MPSLPRTREEFYRRIDEAVEHVGHMVMGVFPEGPDKPGFSYTIGLAKDGTLPELLIFGIEPEIARQVLNGAAVLLKTGELELDSASDRVFKGLSCRIRRARESAKRDYSRQAGQWLGRENYDLWMLVWPDTQGRFPGDPAFESELGSLQPQVWIEPRHH